MADLKGSQSQGLVLLRDGELKDSIPGICGQVRVGQQWLDQRPVFLQAKVLHMS